MNTRADLCNTIEVCDQEALVEAQRILDELAEVLGMQPSFPSPPFHVHPAPETVQ